MFSISGTKEKTLPFRNGNGEKLKNLVEVISTDWQNSLVVRFYCKLSLYQVKLWCNKVLLNH